MIFSIPTRKMDNFASERLGIGLEGKDASDVLPPKTYDFLMSLFCNN